jgi:hypothetical protein
MERELLVARGRHDGRTVMMVPEVKGTQTTGITLLHVRFDGHAAGAGGAGVLQGWDRRYDRLVDWCRKPKAVPRRPAGRDPVVDLLTVPVSDLARALAGPLPRPAARDSGRAASMVGVGLDRGRHRALPRGRWPAGPPSPTAVQPRASELWRRPTDPVPALAVRFAAKEAVMKALGVRAWARSRSRRSRCCGMESGAPEPTGHRRSRGAWPAGRA